MKTKWNTRDLESWSGEFAKGKIISLGGHQTHYVERGINSPLIALHGFFFDHHLWDPNIKALAKHFTVFAPDLWGFGASTRESLVPGYSLYTKQLLLLMDSLKIDKAHLMGQSMGGGIVINFAVQHPTRVKSIVLVDSAALPNALPLSARLFNLPGVGEFFFNLPGDKLRKYFLYNFFVHQPESITEDAYRTFTSFHQVKGTTEFMLSILRKKFFDTLSQEVKELSKLGIPVQIFWGREEKGIPLKAGRRFQQILPQAKFNVIDRAAHCPNLDCPRKFNEQSIKFLKTHS